MYIQAGIQVMSSCNICAYHTLVHKRAYLLMIGSYDSDILCFDMGFLVTMWQKLFNPFGNLNNFMRIEPGWAALFFLLSSEIHCMKYQWKLISFGLVWKMLKQYGFPFLHTINKNIIRQQHRQLF